MTFPSPLFFDVIECCPNCGGVNFKEIGAISDSLVTELNRIQSSSFLSKIENRMVRCRACGAGFLNPRLDGPSLQRLYDAWYNAGYARLQQASADEQARFEEFKQYHLNFLTRFAKPPGRLLDVGTGTGVFVKVAEVAGYKAIGIEWSEKAVEIARSVHQVDVRLGVTADVLSLSETFDVVTMFDYLEHSTSPSEDIDLSIRCLAPGGILAIRVPNARSWQAKLQGMSWVGIISFHLTYFDRNVLCEGLSRRGLDVIFVNAGNYQTFSELLRRKIQWICSRAAGNDQLSSEPDNATASGTKLGGLIWRVLSFAKSSALEVLDHVAGWFNSGNNLFVIARKPGP